MANDWERFGKRLLRAPLYLAPRRRHPWPVDDPPPVHSVLVLRPDDRIGNMVLLTPLLEAIHRAWPGARLDLVAARVTADLLARDPRIHRILVFDKKVLVRNPLRLAGFARELTREVYDLAVDASHPQEFSLTASLMTAATRARHRIGYVGGPAERFLDQGLAFPADLSRHQSELFLDLLRMLRPEVANPGLSLPLAAGEAEAARERLRGAGVESGPLLIGIHPGGRGGKRWPLENFVGLARRLEEVPGRRVVFFHGPGEESLIAAIPAGVGRVAPRLPVRSFAAALRACRLFISGDTGPMHLAAAVGTPTLALFLKGNHRVFGPPGPPHRVLYDPALSVDAVFDAASAMLAGPPRD